jgi:light-harvesting complex II chlorophyll a/b binding protein 4
VLAGLSLDADALQAVDKSSRSAEERNTRMLSLTPEEQQEKVMWMRSSELKHGRLAMLAAAGWPLAEIFNRGALKAEGFTNGRAPSLFNGHLLDYFPFLVLAFGGLAALELRTKDTVKDGDYGFDPLEFSKNGGMNTLQTAEIKHGRAAMMAITGFAVQEFVYGTPVIEQTSVFFTPFGGQFS